MDAANRPYIAEATRLAQEEINRKYPRGPGQYGAPLLALPRNNPRRREYEQLVRRYIDAQKQQENDLAQQLQADENDNAQNALAVQLDFNARRPAQDVRQGAQAREWGGPLLNINYHARPVRGANNGLGAQARARGGPRLNNDLRNHLPARGPPQGANNEWEQLPQGVNNEWEQLPQGANNEWQQLPQMANNLLGARQGAQAPANNLLGARQGAQAPANNLLGARQGAQAPADIANNAELIMAKQQLALAQTNMNKLDGKRGLKLDDSLAIVPLQAGKTSLHLVDPTILPLIPFEYIEIIDDFYYISNIILTEATSEKQSMTVANAAKANANAAKANANAAAAASVANRNTRRRRAANAANARLAAAKAARGGGRNFNGVDYNSSEILYNEIIIQEKVRRKEYARKLATINGKSIANRTEEEKEILKKDVEVQAEYLDQAIPNKYPLTVEGAVNAAYIEDDVSRFYRIHYHTGRNQDIINDCISPEGLLGLIKSNLDDNANTYLLACWTKMPNQPPGLCNRKITEYQLFKAIIKEGVQEHIPLFIDIVNRIRSSLERLIKGTLDTDIRKRNELRDIKIRNDYTKAEEAFKIQDSRIKAQRLGAQEAQLFAEVQRIFNTETHTNTEKHRQMIDRFNTFAKREQRDRNMYEHFNSPIVELNGINSFCPRCAGYLGAGREIDGCAAIVAGEWDRDHDCRGEFGRYNMFPVIREQCKYCSAGGGTGGGHSHRIIKIDGLLGEHERTNYTNDADWYGDEIHACLATGGGGYMERVGKILAFRDYAKSKIRENPTGFTLTFPELLILANKYSYMIRKYQRQQLGNNINIDPNEQNIIDRCLRLIAIKDQNDEVFRRTGRIQGFVWPPDEEIMPALMVVDRDNIEREVRRRLGMPAGPVAPRAAPPDGLCILGDELRAQMLASGMSEDDINDACAAAAAAGPDAAAGLANALHRVHSNGGNPALAIAGQAVADADPQEIRAADDAAQNPGIAQRVWGALFGLFRGGKKSRTIRVHKHSVHTTRNKKKSRRPKN